MHNGGLNGGSTVVAHYVRTAGDGARSATIALSIACSAAGYVLSEANTDPIFKIVRTITNDGYWNDDTDLFVELFPA